MHRSGTSALARALAAMGANAGSDDELLPPHPRDNPTGYWERTDLMLAHDRFLAANGRAWDRVAGFDAARLDPAAERVLGREIETALAGLRAGGRPWLVKDPRLCLLLPLWLPHAGGVALVVAVRDPREIAASLVETHRGVYPSHFLIALWQKYTSAMLAGLAGRRALFVSYSALLEHPARECRRIRDGLAALGVHGLGDDTDRIAALLDSKLRRSTPAAHATLSAGQAELYEWLVAQTRAPGPVAASGFPTPPAPDAELAEVERALADSAQRARNAATGEFSERLTRLEERLNRSEDERSAWLGELSARREHVAQLEQALGTAHSDQLALQRASDQAVADSTLKLHQAQHAGELALAESAARLNESNIRLTESNTRLTESNAKLTELNAQLTESEVRLSESNAKLAESEYRLAESEDRLAESNAALERLGAEHAALGDIVVTQHTRLDELAGEIEDLRSSLDSMLADRDAHQAVGSHFSRALDEQTARADALERELAAQIAHADALERELASQIAHAEALRSAKIELQRSWSWRLSSPLRVFSANKHLLARAEHALARAYYGFPGVDMARKRRAILWLHRNASWLTRGTMSHQLLTRADARAPAQGREHQRIDAAGVAQRLATIATVSRFGLVLRVRDIPAQRLLAVVDSIRGQFHSDWQLTIVDHGSTALETIDALYEIEMAGEPRIAVRRTKATRDAAAALNEAASGTDADFLIFLDGSGELARDALFECACRAATDDVDLLYADEDTVHADGTHTDPLFKPDFSLEYLFSTNYFGGFVAIRRRLFERIGGWPRATGSAYAMALRATEGDARVAHVAEILFHRYADAQTAVEPAVEAAALRDSLARRGIDGDVEPGRLPQTWRVRRRIAGAPLVSILLPFRDKPGLLRTCVGSLLEKTQYRNFELVGIDNGSVDPETLAAMREFETQDNRVRFIRHDVPFNYSAIVNFGVTQSSGEHLLMLNNDTEVIGAEWIEAMLEHSQRPEVGAVGALLLYPNDLIQHAGVIVGLGGVAGHAHLMLPARAPGYGSRAQVIQNLSAVTFACAMTRRDVYDRLGGLDERNLIAAYNDIDYCLRLCEAGYEIIYTPYAELYHHESASRPHDLLPEQRARYEREIYYMKTRHAEMLARGDPYYNRNLSLAEGYVPLPDFAERLPA